MLTCIYCGGAGPFSDEHVIPAGLGGDDRRFMLKNLVCSACNTGVFSKMEATMLRSSPIALARQFLQRSGRRRGSQQSIPKLDAKSKTIIGKEGNVIEVELGVGGRPITLPQIDFVTDSECDSTALDAGQMAKFLASARRVFNDHVLLVLKQAGAHPTYLVRQHVWVVDRYVEESSYEALQAPKLCIWLAAWSDIRVHATDAKPRLFQRKEGQLVLRISNSDTAHALTFFRKATSQVDVCAATVRIIEHPLVQVRGATLDIHITDRVLAKIGLNLLTYVAGDTLTRDAAFDSIKHSIFRGTPELPHFSELFFALSKHLFSGVPTNHHVFMLACGGKAPGPFHVMLITRLYGSEFHAVKLCEYFQVCPLPEPVLFTVDFNNHWIEQRNWFDFQMEFPPRLEPPLAHAEVRPVA